MVTIHNLYDMIKMFLEEENDEDFRSAVNSQKIHQYGACIDRLVFSFDVKT